MPCGGWNSSGRTVGLEGSARAIRFYRRNARLTSLFSCAQVCVDFRSIRQLFGAAGDHQIPLR